MIRFLIIFILTICINISHALSQQFNFDTKGVHDYGITMDSVYINTLSNPGFNYNYVTTIAHDKWSSMMSNTAWRSHIKFKSLQAKVEIGINHSAHPKHHNPFVIKLLYSIYAHNNPQNPNQYTFVKTDTIVVAFHPDSLSSFQDRQIKMYPNIHKLRFQLDKIIDITDANNPLEIHSTDVLRYRNVFINIGFNVQAYYLKGQRNNGTFANIYGANSEKLKITHGNATNNKLPITWNYDGITDNNRVKPAYYELEWTYIDDYAIDPTNNYSIGKKNRAELSYDFRSDATRVVLEENKYDIPLIYNSGYIIYRVRIVKPDSLIYKDAIYGPWSLVNSSGKLNITEAQANSYQIDSAYWSDKGNWQYTVSFAEQGKYKHVLSFYDGLLKNRQSITRFNSDSNQLIATEQIYDFEGRPAISILPTPLPNNTFSYVSKLSLNKSTNLPYQAADFDLIPEECNVDEIISPLADSALAHQYYSHLNPDKTGLNAYIPHAGGYPFVHTTYSPGFSDRVEKQGGAGDSLQIGFGHYQKITFASAEQSTLNQVFGLNIGNSGFYRKQITRDPNGQYSLSYNDYKGNTVFTSLTGIPDTSLHPLVKNTNVNSTKLFREDFIRGTYQQRNYNSLSLEKNIYDEEDGNKDLTYKVTFTPYQTFCPGVWLTTDAFYKYKLISDCGSISASDSGVLGTSGVTLNGTSRVDSSYQNTFLSQGKYLLQKNLTIDMDKLYSTIDSFIAHPSTDLCINDENWFIKESVLSEDYSCPSYSFDNLDCISKKNQMINQLWPSLDNAHQDRVYGQLNYNDLLGWLGGYNSVFQIQNKTTKQYYSYEYLIGSESYGIYGNILVLNGDSIEIQYPWQDSCINLPDSVFANGKFYTDLKSLPFDTFIAIFNSSIAEALLPLHPEFCDLENCEDDIFPITLHSLKSGDAADSANLLYLANIVLADTLYTIMQQHPNLFPSPMDSLMYMDVGYSLKRLDTAAMLMAYCNCSDSIVYNTCLNETFNNEISNYIFNTKVVKDKYFEYLRTLYVGNRTRYLYLFNLHVDSCNNCAPSPINSVSNPVFPRNQPSFETRISTIDSNNTYQNVLNFYAIDSAYQAKYDSAVIIYNDQLLQIATGNINGILRHLVNCGDSLQLNALRDTLYAMHNSGRIYNGAFSPDNVRYALNINGFSIDNLCNPYLFNNVDLFRTSIHNYKFECKSNLFNNDVYTTISNHLLPAISISNTPININLSNSNALERAILNYTGQSNVTIISEQNSSRIKVSIIGQDTVNFYISTAQLNLTNPLFDRLTYNLESYHCILDQSPNFFAHHFENNIANYIGYFVLNHQGSQYFYYIWNDKIELNQPISNHILSNSISCATFKPIFENFIDTMASINVNTSDAPLYSVMLKNYMDYQLLNSYTEYQYVNFISTCAFSDSLIFKKKNNYLKLTFPNLTAYNNFVNQFNGLSINYVYQPVINVKQGNNIISYYNFDYIDYKFLYSYKKFIYNNVQSVTDTAYFNSTIYNNSHIGYLYTNETFNIDSLIGSVHVPNVEIIQIGSKEVTKSNGNFQVFNEYVIRTKNNTVTPYEMARTLDFINKNVNSHLGDYVWIPSIDAHYDVEHDNPYKIAYRNYVNQLEGNTISDSLMYNPIDRNIPLYSNINFRYANDFFPSEVNNIYYRNDTVSANNAVLNYILSQIRTALGANTLFFYDTFKVLLNSSVERLDGMHMSDGTFWFRYFDYKNQLYNVFIQKPFLMFPTQMIQYKYQSHQVNVGPEKSRSFTLNVRDYSNNINMELLGFTDFVLGDNNVMHDVLLSNPINQSTLLGDTVNNCQREKLKIAIKRGKDNYRRYIDSIRNYLAEDMLNYLLTGGGIKEELIMSYNSHKFNYTLYYYDRVGNLIHTVPPAGVATLPNDSIYSVDNKRDINQFTNDLIPNHKKVSSYKYNSINQVVDQLTPDGGSTVFFYDKVGRPVFSQNDKQKARGMMSYTLYDNLGRIIEVGQTQLSCIPYFDPYPASPSNPPINACAKLDILNNHYTPYDEIVTNILSYNANQINNYIRRLDREEVILTHYDAPLVALENKPGQNKQENLRNRVAAVSYYDGIVKNDTSYKYDYATHYSYDIAGNVKTLVRDFPTLSALNQQFKRIDYDYDLISGKVNMLSYNRSFGDQYYQLYEYDADNRIIAVKTSADGEIWNEDARYEYYKHGPLARTSIGEQRVQGVDYIYTIQGWLKSINGDALDTTKDPSKDQFFHNAHASDVAGISLDYFKGDYRPISDSAHAVNTLSPLNKGLYNGNIPRMHTNIKPFDPISARYNYDQLNRLIKAEYAYYSNEDTTLNNTADYKTAYEYDADGNLLSLVRNGNNPAQQQMDSLQYYYQNSNNNKLINVQDYIGNFYDNDIKQNLSFNQHYQYDAIGNLTKDLLNGIDTIQWNLQNKVKYVDDYSSNKQLKFAYDGMGYRYLKTIQQPFDTTTARHEYYVRDAQGNILATYNYKHNNEIDYIEVVRKVYHKWWLETLKVAPWNVNTVQIFFRDLVKPINFSNLTFVNAYQEGLINDYPDFVAQLLDTTPVSRFIINDAQVRSNVLHNVNIGTHFFTELNAYEESQNFNDSILSKALNAYLKNDVEQYVTLFSSVNENVGEHAYKKLLTGFIHADTLLEVLFNAYQIPMHYLDDLRQQVGDEQQYSDELYNILNNHGVTDLGSEMRNFADDETYHNQLNVYWSGVFNKPNFFDGNEIIENSPAVKSILINSLVHQENLVAFGSFMDQYGQAKEDLISSNNNSALVNALLSDTAYSIANIYVPQYMTYDDALIIAASAQVVKQFGMNAYSNVILEGVAYSTYTLVKDTIETVVIKQQEMYLAEHHLYGSSRLGIKKYLPGQIYAKWDHTSSNPIIDTMTLLARRPWYSLMYKDQINAFANIPFGNGIKEEFGVQHVIGLKQYELTNHLGNVMATVSDLPYMSDGEYGYYRFNAAIKSAYDYYPFGSLKPGRYTSDTSSNCVTLTQNKWVTKYRTDSVWVNHTLVVRQAPSLLNVNTIANEVVAEANDLGSRITFTGVAGANAIAQAVIPTTVSAGVLQELTLSTVTYDSNMVLSVTEDVNGKEVVLHTGVLAPLISDGGAQLSTVSILPQTSNVKVKIGPAYILTPGTAVVVDGYWKKVTTPYQEQEQILVTLCDSVSDQYRFGFNGMEKDNELKGVGNSLDFGARMYDSRLGRWLSLDPLAAKYPDLSPYNFADNNPIILKDPDGRDIVYFNSLGEEIKRTSSAIKFQSFVDVGGQYQEAPMPKIIKGYEKPVYQKYDYLIAAHTFIFNALPQDQKPANAAGHKLLENGPEKLDPTLVKAIIMEETKMGTYKGRAPNDGTQDIMQSNVWYSEESNDWGDFKSSFGLKKKEGATPTKSVYAGIRILYMKGLKSETVKNEKGKVSGYKVSWRSPNKDWMEAVKRYNGGGNPNYQREVKEAFDGATEAKPENYYEPPISGSKSQKK